MLNSNNILRGLITVIFAVLICTCTSCNNTTEPEKEDTIVGTWQMVTIMMYDTPAGTLTIPAAQFLAMSETGATTSVLQFNEDGSASVATTYSEANPDTIAGTWVADGDQLTVVGAGIDDTVTFKVDDDVLTLSRIMSINFVPNTPKQDVNIDMIYDRIKD